MSARFFFTARHVLAQTAARLRISQRESSTRVFTCRYPALAREGESWDNSVLLMTVTLKITWVDERMRRHTKPWLWACWKYLDREKYPECLLLFWDFPQDPNLRCRLLQPCNLTATVSSLFQNTQLPGRSGWILSFSVTLKTKEITLLLLPIWET